MDIMRSVLVGVRSVRGKAKKAWTAPLSCVSFNLIRLDESPELKIPLNRSRSVLTPE